MEIALFSPLSHLSPSYHPLSHTLMSSGTERVTTSPPSVNSLSVLLLHLFTAEQVATDPIKQLRCHIFKSRCSNNSGELQQQFQTVKAATFELSHFKLVHWCYNNSSSWHILTATSQAGATITVHMRGATSAIRRAQLYCQVPVRPSVAVPQCHTIKCHTTTLPHCQVPM